MSINYDNWERLVAAVLRREHDRRLALSHSTDLTTIYSPSSSFNSVFYDQLAQAELDAINSQRLSFVDYEAETNVSYSLDESGKRCIMVGARSLEISFGNVLQNWKWRTDADSRFSEVAELQSVWRLDIRAKIKARMLQPRTVYAAYLVFKTADKAEGLESVKTMIRFVGDESDSDAVKRGQVVHLLHQPVNDVNGETAVERDDGWMEVGMGNFYVGEEDDGDVEARLLEIRGWKTGLIVQGIVFRPTYTFMEEPLVSKKYMLSNAWG